MSLLLTLKEYLPVAWMIVKFEAVASVWHKSRTDGSSSNFSAGIYLLKVNNGNKTKTENLFKVNNKDTRATLFDVVLVSSFLKLNSFRTLFWCFHNWLEQMPAGFMHLLEF